MNRIAGAMVLALLGLHALELADLQELLYACHVATALVGVGLIAGWRAGVATGFLFHLAVGFPSWLLDAIARGTTLASVAVHLAPLVAGGVYLRRRPLPPRTILFSWGLFLACCVASYLFTDPALNVNVVHAPWPPTARLGREGTWVANGMLSIAFLLAAERLWRSTLGRHALSIDHRAV